MKKILLLLILISFNSYSQKSLSNDYDYNVSKAYKAIDGEKYFFNYGDEIIVVKRDKNNILVQKFSTDKPTELKHTEYSISDLFPKNWVMEGVEQIDDVVYLFYSSYEGKETLNERLYAKKITFKDGIFEDGFDKQIIGMNGKVANNLQSARASRFTFNYSFNGNDKFQIAKSNNRIVAKYRRVSKEIKDKNLEIIGMQVFDKDLEKVWENDFTMPYPDDQIKLLDYTMDNNANVYALIKKYDDGSKKDKKDKKDGTANYHMELFKFSKESKDAVITKIVVGDKFLEEVGIFKGPQNTMFCGGYFSDGGRKSGVNGIFYFKIDADGSLIEQKTFEIPLDILNQNESNKTERKNNKNEDKDKADYKNLDLNRIYFQSDGTITFFGEEIFAKEVKSRNGSYYIYHNDDILVSQISASGEMAWTVKIPKRQISGQTGYGISFTHFYKNGNHYLIYLDNVKNIDLPKDELPATHTEGQGGYLTAVKIDSRGDYTKGSILDLRNVKGNIELSNFDKEAIIADSENNFYIEFSKSKKEDVLVKVELK